MMITKAWLSRSINVFPLRYLSIVIYTIFFLFITVLDDSKVIDIFGRGKTELLITASAILAITLLLPAIKAVDTIFNIYKKVELFDRPAVIVEMHDDTDAILSFVSRYDYDTVTIYLGFTDVNLVRGLIALVKADSEQLISLYINPCVISMMIDNGMFAPATSSVYVTDCPRESCVAFAIAEGEVHCLTSRAIPSQKGRYWTVTLEPGSDFASHLRETFLQHYQVPEMAPVRLESATMARFLANLYTRRKTENRLISLEKKMGFSAPKNAYTFATDLLYHAQTGVSAIDFMLPDDWARLWSYEQAHAMAHAPIERIHIYELTNLEKQRAEYAAYVARHLALGIRLLFINKEKVIGIFPMQPNGFVIIDEQVVLFTEDGGTREECAALDFNARTIRECLETIAAVKARGPTEIRNPADLNGLG